MAESLHRCKATYDMRVAQVVAELNKFEYKCASSAWLLSGLLCCLLLSHHDELLLLPLLVLLLLLHLLLSGVCLLRIVLLVWGAGLRVLLSLALLLLRLLNLVSSSLYIVASRGLRLRPD